MTREFTPEEALAQELILLEHAKSIGAPTKPTTETRLHALLEA